MDFSKYKRILLIGCPGSGKSTLAKRIGKVTSLPVIHLDTIYWLPNWERRSIEEFNELLLNELNKEKWVIDGNYNRTLDLRVSYCDLIIYLDIPRRVCLASIIKRRIKYRNKSREDMQKDCKEVIDYSFISYVYNFNKTHKERYYKLLKETDKDYIIIKRRKDIDKLFEKDHYEVI